MFVLADLLFVSLIDEWKWWRNLQRTYVGVRHLETLEKGMILSNKNSYILFASVCVNRAYITMTIVLIMLTNLDLESIIQLRWRYFF